MKTAYQIRKTLIREGVSILMNDSLGQILEYDNWDEVCHITTILNSNSDSNCKYEIVTIQSK